MSWFAKLVAGLDVARGRWKPFVAEQPEQIAQILRIERIGRMVGEGTVWF